MAEHFVNPPRGSFIRRATLDRRIFGQNAAAAPNAKKEGAKTQKPKPLIGKIAIDGAVIDFFAANKTPVRASLLYWEPAFRKYLKGKKREHEFDELLPDLHRAVVSKTVAGKRIIAVLAGRPVHKIPPMVTRAEKLQVHLQAAIEAVRQQAVREDPGDNPPAAWHLKISKNLECQGIHVSGESIKAIHSHLENGDLRFVLGPGARQK